MFSDPVCWLRSGESAASGATSRRLTSFLVVTPFYNAEPFIVQNAQRTLCQVYHDFRVVFIDDASTDRSLTLLEDTIRRHRRTRSKEIHVVKNATRQGSLANTHRAILAYGTPQDVIVTVDGDDWLVHEDVLTIVNARYQRDACWVMYGGATWKPEDYQTFESSPYSAEEIANLRIPLLENWGALRTQWKVQHLRTFRYALHRQLGALDPGWSCLKDGDGCFYKTAGDVAMMLPLIELAGEERTRHNRSKLYVYNQHQRNERELDRRERLRIEREIRAKPSFPRLLSLDAVATRQSLAPAFVRPARESIGSGIHTSGWPVARRRLEEVRIAPTVVLDDCVEQTFCYTESSPSYKRPWVGIFHLPPRVPAFTFPRHSLEVMFQKPAWRESEQFLVGAIALSNHLAEYLRTLLRVPVRVIKLPLAPAKNCWCEKAFLAQPTRNLTQLGGYLRNTRAIFQVPPVDGYRRVRHMLSEPWLDAYDARVRRHWEASGQRLEYDGVIERGFVPVEEYERVLAADVVLSEVFAASANNVVVECLVHNTPLLINRHPAVMEYLGPDYPLYFDTITDVPRLLGQENIVAAHRYLAARDKSESQGEFFRSSVENALQEFVAVANARWNRRFGPPLPCPQLEWLS
jgi:glycosyltransferase involved in cell wall biosynthesis